jgi:hypothetical protein
MDTVFTITDWLNKIGSYGLILATGWGLLALMVKDVRRAYGNYLTALSYLLGLALWLLSAVVVHGIWGWIGFFIGVFIGGVGVGPLSLIASAIHGEWKLAANIFVSLTVLLICRYGGIAIVGKDDERRRRESERVETLERRVKALEREQYSTFDFEEDDD